VDIVASVSGFGQWILENNGPKVVVIGRDARISGPLVSTIASSTLQMMGISVVDLGLSTTPTVEMAVVAEQASGGIILTASHNPKHWNALKLLNHRGEFVSTEDGAKIQAFAEAGVEYAEVDELGQYVKKTEYLDYHIEKILDLPLVNSEAIREKAFKVVVDGVNSSGAVAVPKLLEALGCEVVVLNGDPTGEFAHNPEPLAENLNELSRAVPYHQAQLGIAVDPDVDRLAFMQEDGEYYGEEYTLVTIADYILKHNPGPTVSNLSSSRALRDVTQKHGQTHHTSKVGEVHVVKRMKEVNAVIGGEGNGGVIYPPLHYGRDALVGIALFLSHMVEEQKPLSWIRRNYPQYVLSKGKIPLEGLNPEDLLEHLGNKYKNHDLNREDGLKIDLEDGWIHLRRSNTEPIVRIYTESSSQVIADNLASKIKSDIQEILRA